MPASKLDRLRAMTTADPTNAFAWYTMAMEEKKTDVGAALVTFARLRAEHPAYVPAYYHHAKTLEEAGRLDEARTLYQEGMAAAQRAGDTHAYGELSAALDLL